MARDLLSRLENWKLSDDTQDIRGRVLHSPEGRDLGRVQDLVADTETRLVDTAVLDNGAEYPVQDLEIRADDVVLHTGKMQHAEYPRTGPHAPSDWRTEPSSASTHPTGPGTETIRR